VERGQACSRLSSCGHSAAVANPRLTKIGMADLGIAPHIIETVLNHVSGHKAGVAGIYNRSSYEREVRTALALWADHIRTIVEGGERTIVAFERVAAL
jgi:hypothetical protein